MSLLRARGLVPLLAAEAVSSIGSQMTFVALPWFVLVTTGSATRMSVVLAVELVPLAVLGIPSGTVVSKLGARRTMVCSDLARVPLMASIPLLHSYGKLSFPVLLVLAAGIGLFLAPYFASQRLVLPELVGDDEATVAQANAVLEGTQRGAALIGPVGAGFLIGVLGASEVLYIDAATFAFSFAVISLFVPRRPPLAATDESRGVLAGIRFLLQDRFLRILALSAMLANGLGQMLSAGLPVLAHNSFHSARVLGVFVASFGGGAVVGSVVAMKVVSKVEPLKLGASAFVALSLPIALLGFHLPVYGVVAALFASAFFGPLVNAPLIGMITMRTPEALRAKVMTAVITSALLAGPAGLVAAGPLIQAWGPRPVFVFVAVGQVLSTIPLLLLAFRGRPAAEAVA